MNIKHLFDSPSRRDIFAVGEKRLERLKAEGRYSCFRSTRATMRKLSRYTRGKPLAAGRINPEFMKGFSEFLEKEIGNSHNTMVENLKVVVLLVEEAGLDASVISAALPARKQTERGYLTEDELRRIMALHLPEKSEIELARDMFYVECRTGLRISDILKLRWAFFRNGRIEIQMQKTGRRINLPLTGSISQVFDRYRDLFTGPDDYIFPLMRYRQTGSCDFSLERAMIYCTARINKQLKHLAWLSGLGRNLSTHMGRHTFATMLLSKGASIFEVKEMLGHRDVKVTQVYAHLLDDRKMQLMQMLE